MPTTAEILDRLAERISFDRAAGWDVSGLQLGDPGRTPAGVAVCHEVTDEVVEAVLESDAELLVTYHPLLFEPTIRLVAGGGPAGRAFRLLEGRVAVAVAHTAFDVAEGGTADALAEAAGLADVSGFGIAETGEQVKLVTFVPADSVESVAGAMAAAGAGVIGRYSGCSFRSAGEGAFLPEPGAKPVIGRIGSVERVAETRLEMVARLARREAVVAALVSAHPYETPAFDVYPVVSNVGFIGRVGTGEGTVDELAGGLESALGGCPGMRVSATGRTLRRVAVIPGSGSSFVGAAASVGADCLVTGDVAHHRVAAAVDRGMSVIDVGHIASERPGVRRLADLVAEVCDDTVDLTGLDPTRWR